MYCLKCKKEFSDTAKFCQECGSKLTENIQIPKKPYNNPYGFWEVTTEGDCEGRSTDRLGVFEGYIDEIAKKLDCNVMYSLKFRSVENPKNKLNKCRNKIPISLDIQSNTWDLSAIERARILGKTLFENRPVAVLPGGGYASVILVFK